MTTPSTTSNASPDTAELVSLAHASRDGRLADFFGYAPEQLDRLEVLAALHARERLLERALVIARGVLALDPAREHLLPFVEQIEAMQVEQTQEVASA